MLVSSSQKRGLLSWNFKIPEYILDVEHLYNLPTSYLTLSIRPLTH